MEKIETEEEIIKELLKKLGMPEETVGAILIRRTIEKIKDRR